MKNTGSATAQEIAYMHELNARLEKNPDDIDALLKKGIVSFTGFLRFDEAEEILKKVVTLCPNNVDALLWLGECLCFCIGNDFEAAQIMKTALEIDPNRADCHMVLAASLDGFDSNSSEAEIHYKKATELEPSWILPRKYLAKILFKRGLFQQALCELEKALPYVPNVVAIKKDVDPIEEYYASFFTGLRDSEAKQKILDFIKRINATAAEKNDPTS